MNFKQRFVDTFRILFIDLEKSSKLIVGSLYPVLTGLTYAVVVFVPQEDGKAPALDPEGWFQHALALVASGVFILAFAVIVVALVVFFETPKVTESILAFGSLVGLSSSPRGFRQAKATLRSLSRGKPSLDSALNRFKQAATLQKNAARFAPELPRTLARVRMDRLQARIDSVLAESKAYIGGDESFAEIRALAGESQGLPLVEDLCYVSVAGCVKHPCSLMVVARFQITGVQALEVSSRSWDNEVAAEGYDFSALLCLPLWAVEAINAAESEDPRGSLLRISAPALAAGTFTDTVAALWRPDRWSSYHQPERLVNAAKRLDSRRKGGENFKIS